MNVSLIRVDFSSGGSERSARPAHDARLIARYRGKKVCRCDPLRLAPVTRLDRPINPTERLSFLMRSGITKR